MTYFGHVSDGHYCLMGRSRDKSEKLVVRVGQCILIYPINKPNAPENLDEHNNLDLSTLWAVRPSSKPLYTNAISNRGYPNMLQRTSGLKLSASKRHGVTGLRLRAESVCNVRNSLETANDSSPRPFLRFYSHEAFQDLYSYEIHPVHQFQMPSSTLSRPPPTLRPARIDDAAALLQAAKEARPGGLEL